MIFKKKIAHIPTQLYNGVKKLMNSHLICHLFMIPLFSWCSSFKIKNISNKSYLGTDARSIVQLQKTSAPNCIAQFYIRPVLVMPNITFVRLTDRNFPNEKWITFLCKSDKFLHPTAAWLSCIGSAEPQSWINENYNSKPHMALQHPHYVVDSSIDSVSYTGFQRTNSQIVQWAMDLKFN